MSDASLEIRLLGPLEVERDGLTLTLPPSRKARALLAYLAATPRAHGREHLCDLLWEGPADPRAALRGALSKLRPLLDDDRTTRLIAGGSRVSLDLSDAYVDLDSVRAAASDLEHASAESLACAAECFRGVFLEGLELPRCYRFDVWCTAERERARLLRVSILTALVARLRDHPDEALRHARDRLLLDPCAEDAHLDVIRLLAELGRTREALEQYETCRRILKSELGARPSRELDALRQAILPVNAAVTAAAPVHPTPHAGAAVRPPLVGRAAERDVLAQMLDDAGRGTGTPMLLLVGEAGIGKTRLLDELGAMARKAGGDVLAGRAFEAEMIRPYGAWIDALRAIPRDEVPVALRPELAPLLPELGPAASDTTDRNRLFEAVAQLLAGRAATHRPLALVLDDLQWIDEASAALLHVIVRGMDRPGVLLACATRRAELEDNPAAARLLRTLRRENSLRHLELAPLDARDVARLVHGLELALDTDRVVARSEGNPLFALELARASRDSDSALPATIEELIDDRLARLDARARALVPWAAALGHHFHLDILARLVELPSAELLLAVEELERRGVLHPVATGYDFIHDVVRDVAYRRTSHPRRRLIHTRIAQVLDDADQSDHELAGEVAHHAALGGDHELAARACLAAARRARWAFAPDEASALATRGVRHLHTLRPEIRLELHLGFLGMYIYPGMREHRPDGLEERLSRIIGEARSAGLQALVHRGFRLIADIHFLDGDFRGALDQSMRAQEAGRAADPATVVRAISDTAWCLGITERDMPRAARLAREAQALAEGTGYEGHELPRALGYVHHHAGELDDAVTCFERAACLARTEHTRWFECAALSRLVMIELERGRATDALARCRELRAVTNRLDEGSDAPFAEALEALARLMLDEADATERLERGIERLRQVDSRWMIAYVQNLAGAIDLGRDRSDAARVRIDEALDAAEVVDRRNEVAVARSLLARIAFQGNDRRGAEAHLAALRDDLGRAGALSARARASVDAAARACGHAVPISPAPAHSPHSPLVRGG